MRSHKLNRFKNLALIACGILFALPLHARSWNEHEMRINGSKARSAQLEEQLQDYIAEKRKTENPEQLRVITQNIADTYAEIQKEFKERRKEEMHMRFQHPEKGDDEKRQYSREKLKSLEEMESEFGLDARLDRIQARVRKVYGTEKPEEKIEANEAVRLPASEPVKNPEADDRIRLAK